jgi:hypothetical protein
MSNPKRLSYTHIRFSFVRATLISFAQRWAIFIALGLMVLGGSPSGTLALAAWGVAPLFQAPQQFIGYALCVCLGYGLLGGVVVLALRPLLLPSAWREAEQALPIQPSEQFKSDLMVVLFALLPLFAFYLLGSIIWIVKFPTWLEEIWGQSILVLLTAMSVSVFLGYKTFNHSRNLGSANTVNLPFQFIQYLPGYSAKHRPSMSVAMALIVLPLIRGTAQRSARLFIFTLVLLAGCSAALVMYPNIGSWALVLFAVVSQTLVNQLNQQVKIEYQHIQEGSAFLPMHKEGLTKSLVYLAILSHFVGLISLCFTVLFFKIQVNHWVFIGFVLFSFLGNTALIISSSSQSSFTQREDPKANVSWWLMVLAISIALATEVLL